MAYFLTHFQYCETTPSQNPECLTFARTRAAKRILRVCFIIVSFTSKFVGS